MSTQEKLTLKKEKKKQFIEIKRNVYYRMERNGRWHSSKTSTEWIFPSREENDHISFLYSKDYWIVTNIACLNPASTNATFHLCRKIGNGMQDSFEAHLFILPMVSARRYSVLAYLRPCSLLWHTYLQSHSLFPQSTAFSYQNLLVSSRYKNWPK